MGSSLSGCSSICESNDVLLDYGLKIRCLKCLKAVEKAKSARWYQEQQTSHSPERSSTCPWKWISMTSPSSVIHEGTLTAHECHAPDKHIHYGCTPDFWNTVNTYTCTVYPCMYCTIICNRCIYSTAHNLKICIICQWCLSNYESCKLSEFNFSKINSFTPSCCSDRHFWSPYYCCSSQYWWMNWESPQQLNTASLGPYISHPHTHHRNTVLGLKSLQHFHQCIGCFCHLND